MLLLAAAAPAWASVFTVDPAGGGDFTDLSAAVAIAADGDTLSLATGTYDPVRLDHRVLRIEAATGAEARLRKLEVEGGDVALDGVFFVEAPDAVFVRGGRLALDNVRFVGLAGDAAVRGVEEADLTLVGVDFDHVVAGTAPVVAEHSRLTVRDSNFVGGLGRIAGGVAAVESELELSASGFAYNQGRTGSGALSVSGGRATLQLCDFVGNVGVDGGAVGASDTLLSGADLSFADGTATHGGHLYLHDGAGASLVRTWMSGGVAQEGGAIAIEDASLSATNLILHQGEASDLGGGLFLAGGRADLRYAVLTANRAGIGGGFAVDDGVLTLTGVVTTNNEGGDLVNASAQAVLARSSQFRRRDLLLGEVALAEVVWGEAAFVDPLNGGYLLTSVSPGLDRGPIGEADPDGTHADMGAFGGPLAWRLPDADRDGEVVGRDCDDTDPAVRLGAPEIWYDGTDQNCDGDSDFDQDGDGWDSSLFGGTDCNDVDPVVSPETGERSGDVLDADCNGLNEVDLDGDGWPVTIDCDDADAFTFPGAPDDWYDGVDRSCDGGSDFDADGDGADRDVTDCDDGDPGVFLGADEVVDDGVDQDCRGGDLLLLVGTDSGAEPNGESAAPDEPERAGGGCSSAGRPRFDGMGALLVFLALGLRRRSS